MECIHRSGSYSRVVKRLDVLISLTYLTGAPMCSSIHRVCRSCVTWHAVARHWQGLLSGGSTVQFLIGRLCATRNSAPYQLLTLKAEVETSSCVKRNHLNNLSSLAC